jgi:hypothetical protein
MVIMEHPIDHLICHLRAHIMVHLLIICWFFSSLSLGSPGGWCCPMVLLSALLPFDTAVSVRLSSHSHLLVVARQLSLGIVLLLKTLASVCLARKLRITERYKIEDY